MQARWPIFKPLSIKGIASIDRVTDVIQWIESIKAAPSRRQGGAVQPRGRALVLVEAANKESVNT